MESALGGYLSPSIGPNHYLRAEWACGTVLSGGLVLWGLLVGIGFIHPYFRHYYIRWCQIIVMAEFLEEKEQQRHHYYCLLQYELSSITSNFPFTSFANNSKQKERLSIVDAQLGLKNFMIFIFCK